MNFPAILWTSVFGIIMISFCNAQTQNHSLSLFSTRTFDVTVTCDLSAFVSRHPSVMVDSVESLQVVQHHYPHNKKRTLATLNMKEKTSEPSPFLNSSSRIVVLREANAGNENASLSLSLSAVHEIPHNQLSYQCRVLYKTAASSSKNVWNSTPIFFAAEAMDAARPGIHVQVGRGLTLTCLHNSSSEDASTANAAIQILKHGGREPNHLCSMDSSAGNARAALTQCDLDVFHSSAAVLARQRGHVFNPTCADDGLYLCVLTSSSASQYSFLQVSSPECSSLSAVDVAKRIGICLLILIVGCLLIALVIYSISLIFIPSSRPGKCCRMGHSSAYYNVAEAMEEEEKYMGIRD